LNRKDILFWSERGAVRYRIANTELQARTRFDVIDEVPLARWRYNRMAYQNPRCDPVCHHCINRRRSGLAQHGVVCAPEFTSFHARKLVLNPVAVEGVLTFRMADAKREIPCVAARP
jgi:hypothetical protein